MDKAHTHGKAGEAGEDSEQRKVATGEQSNTSLYTHSVHNA